MLTVAFALMNARACWLNVVVVVVVPLVRIHHVCTTWKSLIYVVVAIIK